jgi:hypothetical protein
VVKLANRFKKPTVVEVKEPAVLVATRDQELLAEILVALRTRP